MSTGKVGFVTGASKGLGSVLVRELLAGGYRVAATSRQVGSLVESFGPASEIFLPLAMEVTNDNDVKSAVHRCVTHFGRVDVIVNNAGYGLIGTLEELSHEEVAENFNVNVYGSLNVIRHAAGYLRQQGSGHIFNISSIGGFAGGFPGFGIYCATKFAMAGFTEALAEELKDFGVAATVIYPGYFRTEFLSSGSIKTAATPIAEYTGARASQEAHLHKINGNQPNDPGRAAAILIEMSESTQAPVHLFLGKDAYGVAEQKMQQVKTDMEAYRAVGTSTGIAEVVV